MMKVKVWGRRYFCICCVICRRIIEWLFVDNEFSKFGKLDCDLCGLVWKEVVFKDLYKKWYYIWKIIVYIGNIWVLKYVLLLRCFFFFCIIVFVLCKLK